jgi:hypothetical protein
MPRCYGKKPSKFHPNTLLLRDYLPAARPLPEAKRAWEYSVSDRTWAASMLGNDQVGDCVIAAMLHYIMAAQANVGKPVTFTTQQALDLYSAITGYDPANPSTDQGTAWTDALAHWQSTGCCGHRILGWAALYISSLDAIKQGIAIFGGVLIGTAVTQSMEDQFGKGRPWNTPFTGEVLGGHGIPWLGFGCQGQTCITWGSRQQMDQAALSQVDEAYVVLTQDWLDAHGTSPSNLHLDALTADLKAIAA